jgi:hypothetical protein
MDVPLDGLMCNHCVSLDFLCETEKTHHDNILVVHSIMIPSVSY